MKKIYLIALANVICGGIFGQGGTATNFSTGGNSPLRWICA